MNDIDDDIGCMLLVDLNVDCCCKYDKFVLILRLRHDDLVLGNHMLHMNWMILSAL